MLSCEVEKKLKKFFLIKSKPHPKASLIGARIEGERRLFVPLVG